MPKTGKEQLAWWMPVMVACAVLIGGALWAGSLLPNDEGTSAHTETTTSTTVFLQILGERDGVLTRFAADGETVLETERPELPDVLIFGDSFTNANQEWIASHFNKTVLIDLRGKDETFSLSSYIDTYDIDILLITLPYSDMFFNGNMYIPLN